MMKLVMGVVAMVVKRIGKVVVAVAVAMLVVVVEVMLVARVTEAFGW